MENASKALIIAGAILLSILIIGIGMSVYRSASGVMGNINMDEQEIDTFNSKFTMYSGNNVSGTRVKALISAIASNNRNYSDDASKQIAVEGTITGGTNGISNASNNPPAGRTAGDTSASFNIDATTIDGYSRNVMAAGNYTVQIGYDGGSGIVTIIKIDRNSN